MEASLWGNQAAVLIILLSNSHMSAFWHLLFELVRFPKEESFGLLLRMYKSGCQHFQSQAGHAAESFTLLCIDISLISLFRMVPWAMSTLPNSRVPQAKPLQDETHEPLGEEGYSPACVGRMGRSRDQWLPVYSANAQLSASHPALPGTQPLVPGCSCSAGDWLPDHTSLSGLLS